MFETAVVDEPSVFEPPKFYCMFVFVSLKIGNFMSKYLRLCLLMYVDFCVISSSIAPLLYPALVRKFSLKSASKEYVTRLYLKEHQQSVYLVFKVLQGDLSARKKLVKLSNVSTVWNYRTYLYELLNDAHSSLCGLQDSNSSALCLPAI